METNDLIKHIASGGCVDVELHLQPEGFYVDNKCNICPLTKECNANGKKWEWLKENDESIRAAKIYIWKKLKALD